MKKQILNKNDISILLKKIRVGRISTVNPDGFPYSVPVHFVFSGDSIFAHGSPKGQKINNLEANPKVCFQVDEMLSIIYAEDISTCCNVSTGYVSVLAFGEAFVVKDMAKKREVLRLIVDKYTPELAKLPMPEEKVAITGVIEIKIASISGKTIER